MMQRIHIGSTMLGMVAGVGAMLLLGAKPAPQAVAAPPTSQPSAARYQVVSAARDGVMSAFVVDTATGKVAIVSEFANANVVTPQWGD